MKLLKPATCVISCMLLFACGIAALAMCYTGRIIFPDDTYTAADTVQDTKKSEEEMFGGGETVTPGDKIKNDDVTSDIEKKSVTFNGFLNSRTSVNVKRSSILRDLRIIDNNNFLSYFQGNFGLDARLLKGIRGYFNISADYYPAGIPKARTFQVPLAYLGVPAYFTKVDLMAVEQINALFTINEVFVDVNISKIIYFRFGKQVLRWGVGHLWTPNDLVNVERKNILDSSQVREGAYGFKVHVPFGTRANIYSFIDFTKARNLSDISMANKVEVLFKNTEMALSILLKKKNVPVYGYDITSRIFGLDVHGEISLSYGDNNRRLRVYPWYMTVPNSSFILGTMYLAPGKAHILDYRAKGKWIPRASAGFGRGFEVKDIKDRIRIDVEAFYNHAGYDRNVFEKDVLSVGYFLSRGLYTPNYYGRYYAGMFITVRQIFVEELSAMVNCIVNIRDQSSVISGMITYAPYYDLNLNLQVNGFIGKQNREYTVYGNYLVTEFSAKLVF